MLMSDKEKSCCKGVLEEAEAEALVRERAVPLMPEINVEMDGQCSESNGEVCLRDTRCLLTESR